MVRKMCPATLEFESEGATLGARTIYFFLGESRVGQTLDAMCQPHGCGRGGRPAHLWHSVLTNLCRWKALPIWALESINRQRWIEMLPGFPDFMIESISKILLHRHVLMLAVLHICSVDVVSFSLCRKTGPPTRATQLNFSAAALTLGSHTGSKQKLEIRKQRKNKPLNMKRGLRRRSVLSICLFRAVLEVATGT